MQKIGSRDDALHPWADARRWLLVVPIALLPILTAPFVLMLVKPILTALSVPMVALAYVLAAAGSSYVSIIWSTAIAPPRGWDVGRPLSVTYLLIAVTALVILLVIDQHPPGNLHENETPELIQMIALGGLGVGAVGAFIHVTGRRREGA